MGVELTDDVADQLGRRLVAGDDKQKTEAQYLRMRNVTLALGYQSLLDQPIASADEELLAVLEQYAENVLARLRPDKTWSARVARLVSTTLCDGKPSLTDVARRLLVEPVVGLGRLSIKRLL